MHTDLFLALTNKENPPRHPLMSALLYCYCPAAAYWWLSGAQPALVFDPISVAMLDYSKGWDLETGLAAHGFDTLKEEAKRFCEQVHSFRKTYSFASAPENSLLFRGVDTKLMANTFGLAEAFEKFGGHWINFYRYVHTRQFLIPDWIKGMGMADSVKVEVRRVTLLLSMEFVRKALQWDTWVLEAYAGGVKRTVVGLFTDRHGQDELRFYLAQHATPLQGLWNIQPEVAGLNCNTGEFSKYNPRATEGDITKIVEGINAQARNGPLPALHALTRPGLCEKCGYRSQCHVDDKRLSSFVPKTFEKLP